MGGGYTVLPVPSESGAWTETLLNQLEMRTRAQVHSFSHRRLLARIGYQVTDQDRNTNSTMSSFREQLGRQDTIQLLTLGASLSLVYSSTTLGVTNFALFVSPISASEVSWFIADRQLFGIVAHENTSSTVPFRQVRRALIWKAGLLTCRSSST